MKSLVKILGSLTLLCVSVMPVLSQTFEELKAAFDRKDYATAFVGYKKLADQGSARAQNNVGALYANGFGVPKDDVQAVIWYKKSAEQGFAVGQFNLGIMHATGRGTFKDSTQAMLLINKSAEQGYANAQYTLGVMYENGQGVIKNTQLALEWYQKAAKQDFDKAQAAVTRLSNVNPDGNNTNPISQDNLQTQNSTCISRIQLEEIRKKGIFQQERYQSLMNEFLASSSEKARAREIAYKCLNETSSLEATFDMLTLQTPKCTQEINNYNQLSSKSEDLEKITQSQKILLDSFMNSYRTYSLSTCP